MIYKSKMVSYDRDQALSPEGSAAPPPIQPIHHRGMVFLFWRMRTRSAPVAHPDSRVAHAGAQPAHASPLQGRLGAGFGTQFLDARPDLL